MSAAARPRGAREEASAMSRLEGPPDGGFERALRPVGPGGGEALHVAIIMDGNGRWAKQRGLPRAFGHRAGVAALRRTVEGAEALGVERLTVFGFSTENWKRPETEVSEILGLMKAYFASDLTRLERNGVKVRIVGRRENLSPDILSIVEEAERRTAKNERFHLQVAFNYGGRADITDAARRFATLVEQGKASAADLDERMFEAQLSTAPAASPDLVIRTGYERRLSNFLLWECAYAELIFQDVYWPDYGPDHLRAAILEFQSRERRFGKVAVDDVLAAG
jgi:undecaprenyl diphosphate synthase